MSAPLSVNAMAATFRFTFDAIICSTDATLSAAIESGGGHA